MKKSIVSVAVLTAVGAASAQSSVTVFGVLDAAVTYGKGGGAAGSSRSQLMSGQNSASRLGFRGTEDLGGGLSASFWLEAAVLVDSGAGQGTNTNNQASGAAPAVAGGQGLTWNRRSTVSLAGGWGELRLGRDYSPQYWNVSTFDPFYATGVGTTATQISAGALGGVTDVRASNAIGYFLPGNLGGVYGQAMYYVGENAPTGDPTDSDGNGWSGRIGYASGPFNIAAGYSRTTYSSGDETHANVGAEWSFGNAKLLGEYVRDKIGTASGKGWLIGTRTTVGDGEIRASLSRYAVDLPGTDVDPHRTKVALGYVHSLSKRTALYTTLAHVRNSSGSAVMLNGSTGSPNSSSSGMDLGIRHNF